ncbi:MAG: hypothetical protein AABW88_02975 [Nanoarchaeota archaeon]
MKKSNKLKNKIIWIILIIIITVTLTRFVFKLNEVNSIYYEREFNATFGVSNFGGFSADTNVVDFGVINTGGTSTKEIVVYHEYLRQLKVKITYSGEIEQVISSVPYFYLEPKTERKINLIARARNEFKNYTGKIKISLIKI